MMSLPNILTLSRIVTLPLLGFLLWWPDWDAGYAMAFALYCEVTPSTLVPDVTCQRAAPANAASAPGCKRPRFC